jgi:hypothetical protein
MMLCQLKVDFDFYMQPSFQMWTGQIQECLNFKKQADAAFGAKDFTAAVTSYTQVFYAFKL